MTRPANSSIVIARDEPAELEYGGSKQLTGLARAYANLVVLAVALDEPALAEQWRGRFHELDLPAVERSQVSGRQVKISAAVTGSTPSPPVTLLVVVEDAEPLTGTSW